MAAAHHVVMVGSMGAGKTTVGRRLADELQRPLHDNDALVEARTGLTAHDVEARDGIDALHRLEATVLRDALHGAEPSVVTAAASVVDDPEARAALGADDVTVVWLRVPAELLERRARRGAHRPDLGVGAGDAAARLDALRHDRYQEVADLAVDVGTRAPDDLVAEIVARLAG